MTDIENDGPETRSRKRRSSGGSSALTDISNLGSNFFQSMTKKFSKKRKTSEGGENSNNGASTTTMSNNPLASSGTSTVIDLTNSTSTNTLNRQLQSSSGNQDNFDDVLLLRCDSEDTDMSMTRTRSAKDIEMERYGFVHPIMPRKLPLIIKGSDPNECLDVYDNMYGFYKENESKFITKSYFNLQVEMTPRIRTVLVDWVIEIHHKYKMQPMTLWMIINLLDRFLSRVFVPRNRLQLAAIVSLLIVCKFEEVHTPEVRDCIFLTDNTYTRADVVQTEALILDAVNYELMVPTPYHFLLRLFRRIKASDRLKAICNYIAERNLHESDVLETGPRHYAAAAVLAGLRTLYFSTGENYNPTPHAIWTSVLQEESGLACDDIVATARQMLIIMNIPLHPSTRRKVEAAMKKYNCATYQNVAQLVYPIFSDEPSN